MSSKTFFWLGVSGLVATGLLFISQATAPWMVVSVLFVSIGMFVRGARVAAVTGKQQETNPTMRIVLLIIIVAVVLFAFAAMSGSVRLF